MFGLKKKLKEEGKKGAENTRNFNAAEEKMRELGIDKKMYSSFLKAKGIGRLNNTPELVDEFLSNEWIIKTDLECLLTLDETYKVKTHAYIADKGVVFKKAINKAEDLRLPWDTITDINEDGKTLEIICDAVTYVVWFVDKNIAQVFYAYVSSHMSGVADDGWS